MADNSLASAASVLYEMRGPMQANYPKDNVLLAEWSGVGAENGAGRVTPLENREIFSGSKVRIPIDLALLQGGGWHSETGTVNAPIAADITEAHINLKRITQPASITLDLEEDSMDNSAIQAVAMLVKKAREALADKVNIAMNGDGTGLMATVSSNTGSGTLVVPVAVGTDFDLFAPGTVCDVLTRSSGANPGNGKRRKVVSFDSAALTVTFNTAQAASDGDSGNITFSSAEGIYVAGSYGQVLGGGLEAAGRGTSFQDITLATYPTYKATDGRNGVSTTAPFSENMADFGQELGLRSGANGRYDFGVGDPAAIRVFKNGKLAQVRYNLPTGQLKSGFSGVQLDVGGQSIVLIPERKHKPGSIKLLRKDAATLYGRKKGPDFEDSTGAIWQRFARSWPKETWLIDRLEWGWHDPSKILYFDNLSTS
jgi:hypothetical protein